MGLFLLPESWRSGGTKVCCCNCPWLLTRVNSKTKSFNFGCCKFWKVILQMLNYIWIFYLLKEFLCLLTSAKCCLIASPISSIYSQKYLNCGSFKLHCNQCQKKKKKNLSVKHWDCKNFPSMFPSFGLPGCCSPHTHSIPRCFDNISADKY